MSPPRSGPDQQPPSLRAAHRARHAAAEPDPQPDFDHADDAAASNGNGGELSANGRSATKPGVSKPGVKWPRFGGPSARAIKRLDPAGETRPAHHEAPADGVEATAPAPQPALVTPPRRAGRNLPAAIGVGVALAGTVVASLLLWKPAFYLVVVVAAAIGTWEMVRAVHGSGARLPSVPLLLGVPIIAGLAWYGGAAALPYGLLGTAVAVLVWRLADGPAGYQRDVVAGLLVAVYVPFLAGFVVLLANPDDGHLRVLATLVAVILSDTGGYACGVFFGRHPIAPSVSPRKSWEGFAGSVLAAGVGGALGLHLTFDASWWRGALFGVAVAAAATLGDLAESMLKRDLRVKDMSSLLPGHGGLMERLDSILIAAPTAYAVLTFLIPSG